MGVHHKALVAICQGSQHYQNALLTKLTAKDSTDVSLALHYYSIVSTLVLSAWVGSQRSGDKNSKHRNMINTFIILILKHTFTFIRTIRTILVTILKLLICTHCYFIQLGIIIPYIIIHSENFELSYSSFMLTIYYVLLCSC